ncbi:MAG: prolyl oligopeptidase family serine peptidase [Herpetosiphonaceae bacterium]|nr:prolyl oligopeptidase family serine peptidase [Herpetosiphonaceae bacterium]
MRRFRWMVMALALLTLLTAIPARAADPKTNVVLIDEAKGELPTVLGEDEIEKIATLQLGLGNVFALSPISPDDTSVLIVEGDTVGFKNIMDGALTPLDPASFGRYVPLSLDSGVSAWVNERILATIGLDLQVYAETDGAQGTALVMIDRVSGAVGGVPITLPENVFVVGLSPNGARVMLASFSDSAETDEPFASVRIKLPERDAAPKLPASFQARFANAARHGSNIARRFHPLNQDRTVLEVSTVQLDLGVYDVFAGRYFYLKTVAPNTSFVGNVWSQDGGRIAFTLTGLYDEEAPVRPIFDGALISEQIYRDATGALPPGDNPFLQNSFIEAFEIDSGTSKVLHAAASDNKIVVGAGWSTDNKTFLGQALHPARIAGRKYPIYIPQFAERSSFTFYDGDFKRISSFTPVELAGPFGVTAQFVSPDEVLFTGIVGTELHPYYYNRISGEFRDIAVPAGSYYSVLPTRHSHHLVFIHSSYTSPPDMYRLQWDGQALYRLTWVNENLREFSQTRQDPVSFKLKNGQTRTGVLIQPADAPFPPKNTKVVVWQEGGPGGYMNNQWAAYVEAPYALLPNFGFALLVTPLAGREGYGPAVLNSLADGKNFGSIDIDEQAEIVAQMIGRGWTSQGKIGITGCSYGGYFAWQSIIRYPTLYSAANPQCALIDHVVEWNRGYAIAMPFLQGATPFAAPEEYRRDSPSYNAGRVKTPVLTFHGSQDFLPVAQNENLHLQLVNQGTPARMIKFIDAGHGIVQSDAYELYGAQEQIQWFRTYLR